VKFLFQIFPEIFSAKFSKIFQENPVENFPGKVRPGDFPVDPTHPHQNPGAGRHSLENGRQGKRKKGR
jgi:hypothetical protein